MCATTTAPSANGVTETTRPSSETRGRFIVLEGLDGAGTTTQARLLAGWLAERGIDAELTREPTDGAFGKLIRGVLGGDQQADPISLALAFAADRIDHLEREPGGVRNVLLEGRWVISDRYAVSSLAYQAGEGLPIDWLVEINRYALTPDLTIFVDTDPLVCLRRIEERGGRPERFEQLDKLKATLRQYRIALERGAFVGTLLEVDGNGSIEEVFESIRVPLEAWIGDGG